MTRKSTTIRLLLINASDNDTERLVSLFRGAGRVARAQRVGTAEELNKALAKPWDLLIADDKHPELEVERCLEHLRQRGAGFPVIVLRNEADLPALFAAGARDVVSPEDEQRLLCAALRELETLEQSRALLRLQQQLQELEQRNALLLGESEQALAYVADGMLISVNPPFAARFGHAAPDDMDGATLIDLVAAEDQESVKLALKGGDGTVRFTALRADGGSFAARMALAAASYEGEPCTQITVDEAGAETAGAASELDAASGLHSLAYLEQQLQLQPPGPGSLLLIGIDDFAGLEERLGFSGSRSLAAALGRQLQRIDPLPRALLARVADHCFAILAADTPAATAQESAEALRGALGEQIFEIGEQSLQCSVSIGIAPLGGSADSLLDRAHATLLTAGRDTGVAVDSGGGQPEHRLLAGDAGALEASLEAERFTLLFQPVISLRGAAGEHYEVLLRLRDEGDELVLPDNFLEAVGVCAENARLDRWVLLEATKRLAQSRAEGHDTRLLINLSANALQDESLGSWLAVALKAADLPPESLILQLREADVSNYLKPARALAEAARQLGCRISLSGFGRQADPLRTVKNLPVDLVQFDGHFTRALQGSGGVEPLREQVTALSAREIRTIVPFVENAAALATLWQVGADFIQGHYLQAPAATMNYEFTDIA